MFLYNLICLLSGVEVVTGGELVKRQIYPSYNAGPQFGWRPYPPPRLTSMVPSLRAQPFPQPRTVRAAKGRGKGKKRSPQKKRKRPTRSKGAKKRRPLPSSPPRVSRPLPRLPASHGSSYAIAQGPEPNVLYSSTCPRWKLDYRYPAWRFEQKNDYNCQFNKLPLIRNFKVEMNRCSGYTKGQCTEWVDGRFYQLTGVHTLFNGDANNWDNLARNKPGWAVSDFPSVPSIIVMKNWLPNVEKEGHVGIVESINSDGTVCTSNWNFPSPMRIGMRNVKVQPGVSFIRYVGGNAKY